MITWKFIHC